MKVYNLEEVFKEAGRPTAGIRVTWDKSQIKNQKGIWQAFDQFIWSNGFSSVVLTLGKGVDTPSDGAEVYIYCQRVISDSGTYTNYVIQTEAPSVELSLDDFIEGKTPDIWHKKSDSSEESED